MEGMRSATNKKPVTNKGSTARKIFLFGIVLIITFLPLAVVSNAPFSGADRLAEEAITAQNNDYIPWFKPVFEPASSEIESLLFALQATLGSSVIFYILGYWRGKKKGENQADLQRENQKNQADLQREVQKNQRKESGDAAN